MKKVVEIYNSNQTVKRFLDVDDNWVQPPSKYGINFNTRFLDIIEESQPVFDPKLETLTQQTKIENNNYIKYWTITPLAADQIERQVAFEKEMASRTIIQDRDAIESLGFLIKCERKLRLGQSLDIKEQTRYNEIFGKFEQVEATKVAADVISK